MSEIFYKIKKSDLSENTILDIVRDTIEDRSWVKNTSRQEIRKLCIFLSQIEHKKALREVLLLGLKNLTRFPGDILFFFLASDLRLSISTELFYELEKKLELFKVHLCPVAMRESFEKDFKLQIHFYERHMESKRKDLVSSLEFFKHQNLEKKVHEILEKFSQAFPKDPTFQEEKIKLKEIQAQEIIHKANSKPSSDKKNLNLLISPPPIYEGEAVYDLFLKELDSDKYITYLLEIFLLSQEDQSIIKLLNDHPHLKSQHFWTYIEYSIKIERHLEVFCELKKSTEKKAKDPFFYFYYLALCLWRLDRKSEAIKIMESIAKIRPHFKQTLVHLRSWQSEYDSAA